MAEKKSMTDRMAAFSDVVNGNIYLQSISQGIMTFLPVIIIGSFASLFSGLPVDFWQNFIQSTGISTLLTALVGATTNMLGLYFTYGVASVFADKKEVHSKIAPILALIVYVTLLPTAVDANGTAVLSFTYMDTQGMILGILVALLTISVYKAIVDAKIVIKMPAGTPEYVSNTFVSLIPGLVIALMALVLRGLFALTPWGNAFDCLYNILQMPLNAIVGENLFTLTIINLLTQVLWFFGIHPGFLSSMTAPIMFGLDGANQAAYAAGQAVPNIIGMAFSYSTTIATVYPAFALALLLFAKSGQLKTVGKISVAPAFFGISEPLIFGAPVVLNPTIVVPWVITPALNFILGYAACAIGIVPRYAGVTVFNFPMIATGILNGSAAIAAMEVVLCVIDLLIFMPFVKMQDKKNLEAEKLAIESEQN